MPKCSEVALELRKLADALDSTPDADITRPLCFFYPYSKEQMQALAKLLPRPLNKFADGEEESSSTGVEYGKGADEALWIRASISRRYMCERVQVGTRVEPAYVLPARPAEVVVPEKVVPVYEYHCGSFLAPEDNAIATEAQP